MNGEHWLQALQRLSDRYSHLGMQTDMDGMSLAELLGLYRFLLRLKNEGA
jgi:hypothetical protein